MKVKRIGMLLAVALALSAWFALTAFADGDIVTVDIQGTYRYDYAYEVLTLVNSTRAAKGLPLLTMDQSLLETGMLRAAECYVYFSHTRPDGSSCTTAFRPLNNWKAENIAAHQSTPSAVMDSWINSAGHYANIMGTNFTSIGVGCFQSSNGRFYWTQAFDSSPASPIARPANRADTLSVDMLKSNLSLSAKTPSVSIHCGDTTTISLSSVNAGWTYAHFAPLTSGFHFSSSNESIAGVSEDGVITGISPGTATIHISHSSGVATGASVRVTVLQKSVKDASLSLSPSTFVYNGSAFTPEVTVRLGAATLQKGIDYDVAYKNNINAGDAAVTITGKGLYRDTATKSFTIKKCALTKAEVSLSTAQYTYNAKAKKPSARVQLGVLSLKKGRDFTLAYSANTKPGRAKATVKGKGNYSGSVVTTFVITPKKPTLKSATSLAAKKIKITWARDALATGYKIQYGLKKDFSGKLTTLDIAGNRTLSLTRSNLARKKTYYVRICSYKTIGGTKYCGPWSTPKKSKIK